MIGNEMALMASIAVDMQDKEVKAVLDKIRGEIENIEIEGYIRDVECFSAGINTALNIIDKYR